MGRKRRAAFTLVEVMLALAVISIGIIAILGLLPIGLQSSRDAADNTLAATIVQDAFSTLRTNSFNRALLCSDCGPGGTPVANQDLASYSGTVSNAYDFEGFGTDFTNAYYKVILNFTPQTPLELTRITASVVWPAQSKAPINTNIFVTSIAKYEQ